MPTLDNNNLICVENKKYIESYSLESKPMICGKAVDLNEAITKIKNILKESNSIHVDGMDCDISTIDKVLKFAEKKSVQLIIREQKILIIYICLFKNLAVLLHHLMNSKIGQTLWFLLVLTKMKLVMIFLIN